MIDEKCKNCRCLFVENELATPPLQIGLCKNSIDARGLGFFGRCMPEICEGADGRRYVAGWSAARNRVEYKYEDSDWQPYPSRKD